MKMNVRLAFLVVSAVLVFVVVIVLFGFNGTFCLEENEMTNTLISNVWIGTSIDMPGLQAYVHEIFDGDLKLILQKNRKCTLEMNGKTIKARWSLKEGDIFIRGRGVDTKGHFDSGIPSTPHFPPTLTLYNLENYLVIFYSEAYLSADD